MDIFFNSERKTLPQRKKREEDRKRREREEDRKKKREEHDTKRSDRKMDSLSLSNPLRTHFELHLI